MAIHQRGPVGDHPHVAGLLSNLAAVHWGMGKLRKAIDFQTRANNMHERQLVSAMALGNERDRRLLLHTLSGSADGALSLHTQGAPDDNDALIMAVTLSQAASASIQSNRRTRLSMPAVDAPRHPLARYRENRQRRHSASPADFVALP